MGQASAPPAPPPSASIGTHRIPSPSSRVPGAGGGEPSAESMRAQFQELWGPGTWGRAGAPPADAPPAPPFAAPPPPVRPPTAAPPAAQPPPAHPPPPLV